MNDNNKDNMKDLRGLLSASSIGLVFVTSIVIGAGIGWWLDSKFNTKPWLMIFWMCLGIASGFKNAWMFYKRAQKLEEKSEKSDKKE